MPSEVEKRIIIQGWKSYRNETVIEPFNPKHNVIVGRNGSGKSNFFAAIRFVLSDSYTNMGREERQALLHEGTGPATMSAYVEIIFDNSDSRFPTGKDEVVLRRSIGLKKDEYSLDKKSATKADVMNLLESAGFSRANPYYIVPQGRITLLTNAKDNERLQLLKEVAGTRVYEQRRAESVKIMDETASKRTKIQELLSYIEERLSELEEEKEELRRYQGLDRERRSLEYTIYHREQTEASTKLEDLEEQRRHIIDGGNQKRIVMEERAATIEEIEQKIREHRQKSTLHSIEKAQIYQEREEHSKTVAQLEMAVKDLLEANTNEKEAESRLAGDMKEIEKAIKKTENTLAEILPQYEEKMKEERSVQESLAEYEQQRKFLYAKQGRFSQFKTKPQRDDFLNKEIDSIQKTIKAQEKQSKELEADKAKLIKNIETLDEEIVGIKGEISERKRNMESCDSELTQSKVKRDELMDRRKELWREDARLDSTYYSSREEMRKAERVLYTTIDKNTSVGLQAIRRIAEKLQLKGVYGPLYELFEVEDRYRVAVEITAGASLFHVVVDTDQTATRVLEQLNKERAGRVTFMPLNRLRPKETKYPDANDALPMVQKLSYDARYNKAFEQVFGKAIICPSLEIASTYARSHDLNAITMDGDRVDRKGALTGGYHDMRLSRLESVKNMKIWRNKFEAEEKLRTEVKKEIEQKDQEITRLLGDIQVLEAKKRQVSDSRDLLVSKLALKSKEEAQLRESLDVKEKSWVNLQGSIKITNAQLKTNQNELQTELTQTLTADEQLALEQSSGKVDKLKTNLIKLSTLRAELESQKNVLENKLNVNLKRRREELHEKIDNISFQADGNRLSTCKSELKEAQKAIKTLSKSYTEVDRVLDETLKEEKELNQRLEEVRTQQSDDQRIIELQQKNAEKFHSKKTVLLQQKEECIKKIRELGILPEDAFEKYESVNMEKLLKQLHKCNESLKKYSHVNKKAFEQYNNFTKQRDQLNARKKELDASGQSIQELIQALDHQKDEVIDRTFKQVAENFENVFGKLVPAGRGRLIMIRRTDRNEDEDDEEDAEDKLENYTGVAIKVSFNSKTDEGLIMQQLSGGQKSLVALALIFAIQKCDPAPFYLFDEIDANLDAQYRTAVASMIHELTESGMGQFITTTFRAELLANADKFYGVTFSHKVSKIDSITKADALTFIEQEQQQ